MARNFCQNSWPAPLRGRARGRKRDNEIMKKNKSKYYLTTILLVYILAYFFKINNDEFTLHEYFNRPNQTYSEQPLLKNVSYFGISISNFNQFLEPCKIGNYYSQERIIWNSIFLSYNSRLLHLLKLNKFYFPQAIRIIIVLQRQNIFHKSSEDEDMEYYLFA